MGDRASCTIRIDGQTAQGTAWLECQSLVVRGPIRLVVPLGEITEASAREGILSVRFGSHAAELELGDAAPRWARKIAEPRSRLAKLGIKPGMRIALLEVADDRLGAEIEEAGATVADHAAGLEAAFVGVERSRDLAQLSSLKSVIAPHGAIWVVRRKGPTAPVSERESMAAGRQAGLVDVKVVSLSATHTAEKFVIPIASRPARPAPTATPGRRAPARRTRRSAPSRGRS